MSLDINLPPHGGNLAFARRRFPDAPEPWLDLSTGISPHPFPHLGFLPDAMTRLPEYSDHDALCALAARCYGAASAENVVAAPGTQILLPLIAGLLPPGRVAVLGPTYAEHARAAALLGHEVREVGSLKDLTGAALVTVVHPNNPCGRALDEETLRDLSRQQGEVGGLLVVDEAFHDVTPDLASAVGLPHTIVLRSFGKFHGLAGLRLGFALAEPAIAARLNALLGPWAVSGPALTIAIAALADTDWRQATQRRLAAEATQLDALLRRAGLVILGGTSLYRLVEAPPGTAQRLGEAGILVREFTFWPNRLRIGLPPNETASARLAAALA